MRKSIDGKNRRVTPPSPSYMSNDQFAGYLANLRTNRTARPGGARPLPSSSSRIVADRRSLDAASNSASFAMRRRAPSQASSTGAASISTTASRQRDYYPSQPTVPLKPYQVVPAARYMERGQRWMEKEEAVSLREAMEDMDMERSTTCAIPDDDEDDESRIHKTALDEAAELVWQHQNGGCIPRPDGPYRYRPHLRKNSYAHARTASVETQGIDVIPSGLGRDYGPRSVSGSSNDSNLSSQGPRGTVEPGQTKTQKTKSYGNIGQRRRRSTLKRNISEEVARPFSGDQIWEEPEPSSSTSQRTTSGRVSGDKPLRRTPGPENRSVFEAPRDASGPAKSLNQIEIHHNPPTQSRNAQYTINSPSPRATPEAATDRKNGVEIRSQDIRAATSKRLKDRSRRLPEPTAVSDSPGRPIVSFDANWEAPDEVTDVEPDRPAQETSPPSGRREQSAGIPSIFVAESEMPRPRAAPRPSLPSIAVSTPNDGPSAASAPMINEPAIDVPKINVPTINVPTIVTDDASEGADVPTVMLPNVQPTTRPLPNPGRAPVQRAQHPRAHWSPDPRSACRTTASCHECGLPIEGRLVALAGYPERFHPHCFSCMVCGTSLEAMEISPEPDNVRAERLDRIRRRGAGECLEELPGMTAAEDGDDRLRFYCHLDWHELFAPRCKHCKTPILGEHVVALGHHWHYGHFFCAECGDPFKEGMTHIEKDGYAWCVNCQTKRTERRAPKCKKCRTAVIGQYIRALGGEWHEHCFRCAECQAGFDDGQIFPKEMEGGTVVLCTACRTRELKL